MDSSLLADDHSVCQTGKGQIGLNHTVTQTAAFVPYPQYVSTLVWTVVPGVWLYIDTTVHGRSTSEDSWHDNKRSSEYS